MSILRALVILSVALGLVACGDKKADSPKSKSPDSKAPASAKSTAPASKAAAESAAPTIGGDKAPAASAAEINPALLDPSKLTEKAPDKYAVKLVTTKGDIIIDVDRSWAPQGADRWYNLVKNGYYNDIAFFRVINGFMAQVGISGQPKLNAIWRMARIKDDPVKQSNGRGMVTFATAGPNTRTTQFFINFNDNGRLDGMGFAPFGKVRDMKTVDALYSGYGEGAPRGQGPSQGRMQGEGNTYLRKDFPNLDYIKSAEIMQ